MKGQGANMGILKEILNRFGTLIPEKKNKFGKEYKARWYRANRSRSRNTQLKYKFGITLEEYNCMVQSQGGVCAICEGVNDTRRKGTHNGKDIAKSLAVDHNHKTGKVRGLLCSSCNTSIGGFKDDPVLLKKAIHYLEKTNGDIQATT